MLQLDFFLGLDTLFIIVIHIIIHVFYQILGIDYM